jgi:NAD-dependent deacetylase
VWRWYRWRQELVYKAGPNPGHRAVAELEAIGVVKAVITQNVDGLHQRAGSRNVVELPRLPVEG